MTTSSFIAFNQGESSAASSDVSSSFIFFLLLPPLHYCTWDLTLILLDLRSWHLRVLSSSSLASSFSIVLWWTHVFQVLCASSCSILLPLWSLKSSYSSWLSRILIIHSFIWSSISFESRNSFFSEDYHKDALSNTIFHIV